MSTPTDDKTLCERLAGYLDADLPDHLRLKVEDYVSQCSECQEIKDDIVALIRCCSEYAPERKMPADVHDSLMEALKKARDENSGGA